MKKSMFILTAALSFGVAVAQTATPAAPATAAPATTAPATTAPAAAPQVPTLTDVPAGHWARDAIDRLVSRGIILGYPDGTYRGTQNLTRYEAAVIIARVLDQIRTGDVSLGGVPAEDLTALQNAIQELAADLTALGVRVSDLEENAVSREDFARLEARVEELGAARGDTEAIAGLQTQIAELTARADEFDALRADVDDNASQIAALNDLTVLLNQDILNLQDRVSAVESAQADFVQRADFDALAGRVGTVETRVTTLENAPRFSVVGTIAPAFGGIALVSGTQNFDVDRLTVGTFIAGGLGDGNVTTVDTNQNVNNAGTGLGFGFGIRATNLATTTGSVVVRNAAINFGTAAVTDVGGTVRRVVTVNNASLDGAIAGQPFTVRYTESGNAFKFSDYLFNNTGGVAGPGFVATFSPVHPLQPVITVVGGNTTAPAITGGTGTATAAPAVGYYGVRVAVKPNVNSTVGVSYAQANRTAFGVDFNTTLGIVNLRGEGVISAPNAIENNFLAGNASGFFTNGDRAFYTEARANLGIANFGVNYRTIDPAFAINNANPANPLAANAGMSVSNTMPYAANQTGFGAALGTTLGPIAFGAYADTYTAFGGGARTTGFGVRAGAQLGALQLVGFVNRATVDNVVVRSASNLGNAGMGIANVPFAMTSSVGAQLSHDGRAPNALVPNLNFTVANAYYYSDPLNEFSAFADYSATVAGLTIRPFARYNLLSDRFVNDRDGNGTIDNESANTIKYGVQLSTAPLTAIPLQPSAYLNFANRITNAGTATGVAAGTTTELLGQAGVRFNQFLAPNATAGIGYSYYQGFNVAGTPGASVGTTNQPFNAADNRIYADTGTQSGIVNGVYAQVGYAGLAANYGLFRYTNLNAAPGTPGRDNVAQGFKVSYTFSF